MSVPSGWREAALGDVCTVVSGATPKTGVADYWDGDVRWLTPKDMSLDRSKALFGGARNLTQAGYASCSARIFPAGSVIVSSRAPVGYVAIAGDAMATNQGCKTAIPPAGITSDYLYWYLRAAKPDLERRASGTTFRELSGKDFAATRLAWPSMEEQRRIVDVLEDHLSRLDAADAYLATADQRLKAFQRAAVDDVMITKATRHDWPLVPLSQFAADVPRAMTDGPFGSSLARQHYTTSGPRVIRLQNIGDGFYKEADAFIGDEHFATLAKHEARGGDVVLASLGDQLPRAAVVPEGLGPAIVKADCIRLRVATTHHAQWVVRATQSSRSKSWARARLHGVGRQRLGMAGLRDVPVPRPPDDASIHVGLESISRAEEIAQRLVREAVDARHRTSTLRRALLTAAFTGRLTGRSSDMDVAEELADERATA